MGNHTTKADQEVDPLLLGWSELFQRELELDQREEKLKRDQRRWLERDRKVGVREEAVVDREATVAVREATVAVREEVVEKLKLDQIRSRREEVVAVREEVVLCAPLRSSPLSERNRTDDYYPVTKKPHRFFL